MKMGVSKIGLAMPLAIFAASASAQILVPVTSTASHPAPQAEPEPKSVTYAAPAPRVAEQTRRTPSPEPIQTRQVARASVDDGGRLDLMCVGGGSANKPTVAQSYGTANVSGIAGNGIVDLSGSVHSTTYGTRTQGFDDQVSLYVQGDEGRIRMPRTMLPPIHGGNDGWFKLKDIKTQSNEITASVAVNPLNNPKLRLDRYSGAISISGKAGDFTGSCRRFVPEEQQKQF